MVRGEIGNWKIVLPCVFTRSSLRTPGKGIRSVVIRRCMDSKRSNQIRRSTIVRIYFSGLGLLSPPVLGTVFFIFLFFFFRKIFILVDSWLGERKLY